MKKILSVALCLILILSALPVFAIPASAEENDVSGRVTLDGMPIVDHGSYQGNQGDSTVYNLNGKGLSTYDKGERFNGYGNVGKDGTVYYNGFEVWIARWNYKNEISWAYATFDLAGKYKTLTGKTNLIKSYNTSNFDTTIYFYDGERLLASYNLTNTDYIKDLCVDVTGVEQLKLLVKDNIAVKGGTSFALYDMFLDETTNGLAIYSDRTNLSVQKNACITIGAAIYSNDERIADTSGITFYIADTSVITTFYTKTKDNCYYVKFKGVSCGTTIVTFNDLNTGYTAQIPITVFEGNYQSYTLSAVPTQNIDKYESNFYNINGVYVDNYDYEINDDKTANISFDVYNSNYIYGAVEVYDSYGNLKDAVLIDKMTNNAGSIKAALWDNGGCLIRDLIDGDFLSYRQESGFTKQTSVNMKNVPAGGYIKITTDPESSFLVGLVNSIDILMSMSELAGELSKFDVNSKVFADKITFKVVNEAAFAEFAKDSDEFSKKLASNISKETLMDSTSLGSFAQTITNNLANINVTELIKDTAADFGWNIGENLFEYFSGPAGKVLKGMFIFGDLMDLILRKNDFVKSCGSNEISIQNQGGGIRSTSLISVKSNTEFTDETALNVFKVVPNTQLLSTIQAVMPDVYEEYCGGLTHTYNISMVKNGQESQLENEVEVHIQIPDNLKILAYTNKVKVYRVENDGTLTEMEVDVADGCFVFKTNHFSLYTIIGQDSSNEHVTNVLDYQYEALSDESAEIKMYYGCDSHIKVPNYIDGYLVTSISNSSFRDNEFIKAITLPESIKEICDYAFYGCRALESITIPYSTTKLGKYVFNNCNNLSSVTLLNPDCVLGENSIPETATIYGYDYSTAQKYAQQYGNEFVSLGTRKLEMGSCGDAIFWELDTDTGVLSLTGTGATYSYDNGNNKTPFVDYRASIKSVVIGDGITHLGNRLFRGATQVESVTFGKDVTTMGYETFYNCLKLNDVQLNKGLTSIGALSFYGCKKLAQITIPSTVATINNRAFKGSGLTSIVVPDTIKALGYEVFMNCANLATVDYTEGVSMLNPRMFENCTSLKTFNFTDNMCRIRSRAFYGCTALESIDFENADNMWGSSSGEAKIASDAFTGCNSTLKMIAKDGSHIENYTYRFGFTFVAR